MRKKRILVIVGHPDIESFNTKLGRAYVAGAIDNGHKAEQINLAELDFDPILHQGYKVIQPLEPDLKMCQEKINWCTHLVIIYPSWWSTMPALLKGFFDRIWLPGFAFHFHSHGFWWRCMQRGKSARVFVTSDSPAIFARIIFGDTTNEIRRGILWFSGFRTRVKKIGHLKKMESRRREKVLQKMYGWGRRGY